MKFLMCRPDYYDVEYEINPWMNIAHKANQKNAIRQWEVLYDTLKKCGAKIELLTPVSGWPDMVFTANAGLFYQKKIILPHFRYKERQGELPYFTMWFVNNGYELANPTIPADSPYFEGAGDALLAGDTLFAGYGFRSDRDFYEQTTYFNHNNLIYCELIDPYFYHIDTCFCPLNDELAIWYPNAFTQASQKKMAEKIHLLPVREDEAKRFACNAVVLNKDIIIPTGCPNLTTLLEKQGLTVHACDMSEFLKAGGACKCLTLKID